MTAHASSHALRILISVASVTASDNLHEFLPPVRMCVCLKGQSAAKLPSQIVLKHVGSRNGDKNPFK